MVFYIEKLHNSYILTIGVIYKKLFCIYNKLYKFLIYNFYFNYWIRFVKEKVNFFKFFKNFENDSFSWHSRNKIPRDFRAILFPFYGKYSYV